MIAYLVGTVADVGAESMVLDVNHVGYQIRISAETASRLSQGDEAVKIYTYMCVREDDVSLFGFLSEDELQLFKKLITVSGIGPKGGLSLLSCISPDSLRFAIMAGDVKTISSAPGIGKRTAERMILELRDKIKPEDTVVVRSMNEEHRFGTGKSPVAQDAIAALTALGYSGAEAMKAVNSVAITEEMEVQDVLDLAFKALI
ncbi:MAG: Holliday junction branch migration protein RuvA [Lachnospiraceae bacterium]|nr:Holliday junction branch migration protein RuvA [Lachnospiraceae bacterium]